MATMIEYSVAEVGTMLEKNGLGKYTAVFKDKGVDGKKLCTMTADELKKVCWMPRASTQCTEHACTPRVTSLRTRPTLVSREPPPHGHSWA